MELKKRTGFADSQSSVAAGLLTLSLGLAAEQYARVVIGANDLWADAADVWLPLAERVAAGDALYVGAAVDNKPPLFQYLNLLVYETGEYVLMFYILVGLVNGAAAWLLYRWVARFTRSETAVIAAVLFVAALPITNGTIINVRTFSITFVLLAVLARSPSVQGASIAAGALFSQYAVFGIPVLLWRQYARGKLSLDSFIRFCVAGGGVVVLTFLPLLWWGVDSLVGGIEWSFLLAKDHFTRQQIINPWMNPRNWARVLATVSQQLLYMLVPAVLYGGRIVFRRDEQQSVAEITLLLFAVFYALTFGIKMLYYYWIMVLPFLAGLAALEVESLYRQVDG